MIDISLNKKLDYETFSDFKDFSVAGVDFGAIIKRDHPEINVENFNDYIDSFYKNNSKLLQKSCDEINVAIAEKQKLFFEAVKKVFNIDSSKKDFRGYASIFNCNPRFVDSNEFQIFYKKDLKDKIGVVFHEVLHFIFFDYCSKNLKSETDLLDKNSGKLWELSEIINVIILNLPEFKSVIEREEGLFYPELEEKLKMVQDLWNKGYDLKRFIQESLIVL